MKNTFQLLIPVLLLMGCKSFPVAQSVRVQENQEQQFRYYDANSKIRYAVFHDDQNLYLQMNTVDRGSMLKIMRGGLSIYFDPSGKKGKEVCLQYPLPSGGRPPREEGGNRQRQQGIRRQPPNLAEQIDGLSKTATFRKYDQSEAIQVNMKSDFQVSLIAENNQELTYRIAIPLQRITQSASPLFLGIESGSIQMGRSGGGSAGGGGRGPGGGGGQRGGGMGGGRPGGGGGPPQSNAMSSPIEFWFQVEGLGE